MPFQISSWSIFENTREELPQDHLGCIRKVASTIPVGAYLGHHQVGSSHSITEARWWHQGDRCGDVSSVEEGGSSHCSLPVRTPPKKGVSAWPTFSRLSPMLTRGQPSCLSMGLVRMTLSPGTQCCRDFHDGRRRWGPPLCGVFLWVPIHIHVGRRDGGLPRATLHHLDSTGLCWQFRNVSWKESASSLELLAHARISVHHAKTQVWNRGVSDAVVWRGAQELPAARQRLKVLGAPIGHPQCVQVRGTTSSLRTHASRERSPGWLVVAVDVRVHPRKFLAPDGVS